MNEQKFDLNIEKILEDWETYHALREIIANAIDEQLLTATRAIEIRKPINGKWQIRDFGRGLKYEHLTQKENQEKLSNKHVIGKFGIGLKDALATFDRKGIKVNIKSRHGEITLGKSIKHGFSDIVTLHACITPAYDKSFSGTEFTFDAVNDDDVKKAMDLFLAFSGEQIIEKTKYGEVLEKKDAVGRVYINGVKVAEEENFLFSYNITHLTKKISKALNRERSNVGRSAYSDRVKSILLSCGNKRVAEFLVSDLKDYFTGNLHEELKWIDVQEHAVKILSAAEKVVFLTTEEIIDEANMIDEAKTGGYRIVTIPDNLKDRISGMKDKSGNIIRDLSQFHYEYLESFEFKFVDPSDLSLSEKRIYDMTDKIFMIAGGRPGIVGEIRISEVMKKELGTFIDSVGVWERHTRRIIIKRSQLRDLAAYAGTLLHETVHARSGTSDVTRDFESALTKMIGNIISKILREGKGISISI